MSHRKNLPTMPMPNCLLFELSANGSSMGVWMRAPPAPTAAPAPQDTLLSGRLYSTPDTIGERPLQTQTLNVHSRKKVCIAFMSRSPKNPNGIMSE